MRISDWSSDVCSSDLKLSKKVEKTMTNQGEPTPPPNEDEENEVLRAARERHEQQEAVEAAEAEAKGGKRGRGWQAAAGLGIGSAAVIAALLYRSEERRVGKGGVSTCRSRWSQDH